MNYFRMYPGNETHYYYYDIENEIFFEGSTEIDLETVKKEINIVNAEGRFFIKLSPFTDAEIILIRMTGCFTGDI